MVNSATYTTFKYSEKSVVPLTNTIAHNYTPYGFRMVLDNKEHHVSVGVCEVCLGKSLCPCQHHML